MSKRNYQGPFKKTPLKIFALGLILIYQNTLSILIGKQCRYCPTCSEYSYEAIARHGLWSGFWLSFFRILRCHPWGAFGYDEVPTVLPKELSWYKIWIYRNIFYKNQKKNFKIE